MADEQQTGESLFARFSLPINIDYVGSGPGGTFTQAEGQALNESLKSLVTLATEDEKTRAGGGEPKDFFYIRAVEPKTDGKTGFVNEVGILVDPLYLRAVRGLPKDETRFWSKANQAASIIGRALNAPVLLGDNRGYSVRGTARPTTGEMTVTAIHRINNEHMEYENPSVPGAMVIVPNNPTYTP